MKAMYQIRNKPFFKDEDRYKFYTVNISISSRERPWWKSKAIINVETSNTQRVKSALTKMSNFHELVINTSYPSLIFDKLKPYCKHLGFLKLKCSNTINPVEIGHLGEILENVQFLILSSLVIYDSSKLINAFANLYQAEINAQKCNNEIIVCILKSNVESVILRKLKTVKFLADAIAASKRLTNLSIKESSLIWSDAEILMNSIAQNTNIRWFECDNYAELIIDKLANLISEIKVKTHASVKGDNAANLTTVAGALRHNSILQSLEIDLKYIPADMKYFAAAIIENSCLVKLRIGFINMARVFDFPIGSVNDLDDSDDWSDLDDLDDLANVREVFTLKERHISLSTFKYIIDNLSYNQSLEELVLDYNTNVVFINIDTNQLLTGLKFNTSLRKLQILNDKVIKDDNLALELADIITHSKLEVIGIKIQVVEETFIALMKALEYNSSIKTLTIILQELTDNMCQAIVHMFQHNNSIQELYLGCIRGWGQVFTFLDENQSLCKISLLDINHLITMTELHHVSDQFILFDKPYEHSQSYFTDYKSFFYGCLKSYHGKSCRCGICLEVENIINSLDSNYTLTEILIKSHHQYYVQDFDRLRRNRRKSLVDLAAEICKEKHPLPLRYLVPNEVWSKLVV